MKGILLTAVMAGAVAAASASDIYFADFEANNGGFAGTGDWEYGAPTGFVGGFSSTEPPSGFSGSNVWGTILGGDHSPSTVSELTRTVDVSGFTGLALSFYEWSDSGGNAFDMAKVLVNGTEVYLSDGDSQDAWRQITIDLSAFDGAASLDINFQFTTTTVVERTGWYIDDVAVSGVPTPGALALLGISGLAATRRRR